DAFLSSLGDGFLRRFYRALVADSGAVAVVAVERGRVIGFGTAAASTREFSRRFYRRHGLSAAFAAAPALVRVGGARGIRESARYAGERNGFPDAEFLTLAVDRGI